MNEEEEQGEWGFKSLKQMMKLLFSMSEFREFMACYTRFLGEPLVSFLYFPLSLLLPATFTLAFLFVPETECPPQNLFVFRKG